LTDADRTIAALMMDRPAVVVLNKIDLLDAGRDVFGLGGSTRGLLPHAPQVRLSALTGEGLEVLEEAIVETVFSGKAMASEAPVVTSPRHREALHRSLDHVSAALAAHRAGTTADLVAIDLTAAVNALGEITGQTASDDLVDTIFGNFCVGK
jgi:tRNA modification GTPase